VARNEKKAVELFTRAAEQGHARAQCVLGLCFRQGRGVAQDKEKAVEWYTRAAKQGDEMAAKELSGMGREKW
jgi:TPR repeat protein